MTNLANLDGVMNFRGMGGLPVATGGHVRDGHVFRSGHLATATDADLRALAEIGIATIIDFRTDVDKAGDGGDDRVPEGASVVHLPMTDSAGRGAEIRETIMAGDQALIEARYGGTKARDMAVAGAVAQAMDPEKQIVYEAFLTHVATARHRPLLFHCSAGKDRAGWAATLLGMALGVSDDDLVEHYLLSNVHRPPDERRTHFESLGINAEALMPFLRVDEAYLRAAFAAIDSRWTSRESYLDEALGFGPAKVARLRGELIE